MSGTSLNKKYLFYLANYPLLTKSVTAGILAGLNETIASIVAKNFHYTKIGGYEIKHVVSSKILTMVIYGSLILTPISHQMYAVLNKVFSGANQSRRMKVLQILASLSVITPTLCAVFTSWISIIENYQLPHHKFTLQQEAAKIRKIVVNGLKRSYLGILKSSLITSLVCLVVAQNFIPPELWVVFFNLVYFVLGTVQNTKVKKLRKKQTKED